MLCDHKKEFIEKWGNLTVSWGVNRGMGLVQAVLLISPTPLCANEIMEELNLSRGCVNMSTHALMDWDLVKKVSIEGERKDYFIAEKDPLVMFKAVLKNRRKKELDPLLSILEKLKSVHPECPASEELGNTVNDLYRFAKITDHAIDTLIASDVKWISQEFDRVFQAKY